MMAAIRSIVTYQCQATWRLHSQRQTLHPNAEWFADIDTPSSDHPATYAVLPAFHVKQKNRILKSTNWRTFTECMESANASQKTHEEFVRGVSDSRTKATISSNLPSERICIDVEFGHSRAQRRRAVCQPNRLY